MQKVIDSHIHFWDTHKLDYPWLADIDLLNTDHVPADVPQSGDTWQIDKLVFVQADCLPEQGIQEAEWVASLADDRIAGIVAFAPLENADRVRETLDKLRDVPKVKGIRRLIQSEAMGFSTQDNFVQGVQILAEYGFTFDICVKHHQLPDAIELVKGCPNTSFVLDHFGKPDIAGTEIQTWRKQITQLAEFDNVMCKLSGLVTEADHQNWSIDDLRPYVDHILDAFGSRRLMFGSDFPVVKLASNYETWLQTALDLTSDLSETEKEMIFYQNAQLFYDLL